MEIKIPLPQGSLVNTYKGLKGYLKQLELAIHHAQKAVDSAEQSEIEITEDCYVMFEHQALEQSINLDCKDETVSTQKAKVIMDNFMDTYCEELQSIDLVIKLQ